MQPLAGYQQDNIVWKPNKCLYGLKQSVHEWYTKLSRSLLAKNFRISPFDPCVFVYCNQQIFILVYVDDIALYEVPSSTDEKIIPSLKNEFQITDLGEATWLLGLHITYTSNGIYLSQQAYIQKILDKFSMDKSSPVSTPSDPGTQLLKAQPESQINDPAYYQAIIGSLMHVVTGTRPDLAFTTTLLSQFNSCLTDTHVAAVKHTLRYLNKTKT
jgi:hypothetical protein